jgi:hypothetical protein
MRACDAAPQTSSILTEMVGLEVGQVSDLPCLDPRPKEAGGRCSYERERVVVWRTQSVSHSLTLVAALLDGRSDRSVIERSGSDLLTTKNTKIVTRM